MALGRLAKGAKQIGEGRAISVFGTQGLIDSLSPIGKIKLLEAFDRIGAAIWLSSLALRCS